MSQLQKEINILLAIVFMFSLSVVYNNVNAARPGGGAGSPSKQAQKRDVQRINDISNIKAALELYFNDHGTYPPYINQSALGAYMSIIPTDPVTGVGYFYAYNFGGTTYAYHLWTELEVRNTTALTSDADFNSTQTSWYGSKINASLMTTETCVANYAAGAARDCVYDVFNSRVNPGGLRDNQRISDIAIIKNAIEDYYFDFGRYPTALNNSQLGTYITSIPVDPYTSASYFYGYNPAASPQQFHLWTQFESANAALASDSDIDSSFWAGGNRGDFNDPSDEACTSSYFGGTARDCIYDVGDF